VNNNEAAYYKVPTEDTICKKTNWTCTQGELRDIMDNISSLSQIGYNLQFYNDKSQVDFLQKPLDTFILDLHSFIIISLITGPIILIVAVKRISSSRLKDG
jgi:hypothetical protein